MNYLKGIKLEYTKGEKRNSYMSLPDLFQDLTTETLLKILDYGDQPTTVDCFKELEKRVDINGENNISELDLSELYDRF